MKRTNLIKKFDRQAPIYEKMRRKKRLSQWRSRLIGAARGKVLELAIGAGTNFPFYPSGVEVTAVDFSPEMIKRAKTAAQEYSLDVEFLRADVEELSFPPDSFDTVISTCSLCGYDDPVSVLNHMNRWCKKDGRILLMEHGISSNAALAAMQKMLDPVAYKVVGCHQKRDMMKMIEESGVIVDKAEHYMAGVVHLVWAQPSKDSERLTS
ncbi:methyltransferase type 11 [Marinithermofilum abyssi]|uniref:Methyltransferase type 11 n=1 Tax=Marinithermofilum abyssi TaxID=1571185 RepID=A0A8J2VIN3_9BACL|nr:class I SAM-dependent methyltransferase [Marinithermofilum abyssi]GGE23526.1 methyltransferase type 11 [Marinithermofilum abyssi]